MNNNAHEKPSRRRGNSTVTVRRSGTVAVLANQAVDAACQLLRLDQRALAELLYLVEELPGIDDKALEH